MIETWFLILTLFFPRIGLLIAYYNGCIPPNTIPFWGDFFMAIFIPRILTIMYIIMNLGMGPWAIAHILMFISCIIYQLCFKIK